MILRDLARIFKPDQHAHLGRHSPRELKGRLRRDMLRDMQNAIVYTGNLGTLVIMALEF